MRRSVSNKPTSLPSDIEEILEKYEDIISQYAVGKGKEYVPRYERNERFMRAIIPLKEHPEYGITGMVAFETYDEDGRIERYSYSWRILHPKRGKHAGHITAWENDPHDSPNTPPEYRVTTEPHHHHHVPFDRRQRKENYDVRTLDDAFSKVAEFVRSGKPYTP